MPTDLGNSATLFWPPNLNEGGGGVAPTLPNGSLWSGLATLVPPGPDAVVIINGFSAVGDGGKGLAVWNPTDTRSSDGGTIQAVTGIATGRWNRVIYDNTINVGWFGADPTGVVDAHSAISSAITACAANSGGGGTIVFNSGIYACSASLTLSPGMSVRGQGLNATNIAFTGATDGLVYAAGSPYGLSGRIEQIKVTSFNLSSGDGIKAHNLELLELNNVYSDNWTNGRGISVLDCIVTRMSHCIVQASGNSSFAQVEIDASSGTVSYVWDQCYVSTGTATTVAGLRIDRVEQPLVRGGAIESTGTPIQIASKTEGTLAVAGLIIEGLDLENPNNGAESYIEMGYGWTGSAGFGVTNPIVRSITATPSGSLTVCTPIKLKNTNCASVEHNLLLVSQPQSSNTMWTASTVETVGAFITPTTLNANGFYFEAASVTGDAKTGLTEPTWPNTIGTTVVDNHVTWTCVGKTALAGIWLEGTTNIASHVGVNYPPAVGQVSTPMVVVDGTAPAPGYLVVGSAQPFDLNGPTIPQNMAMTGATPSVASATGQIGLFITANGSATNVTNITGALATGQTLVIYGNDGGHTTLKNNSGGAGSMIFADGLDMVVPNGQTVTLIMHASGNWYEPGPAAARYIIGIGGFCGVNASLAPVDDADDCGFPGNRWHGVWSRAGLFGGTSVAAGNATNLELQAEAPKAGSGGNGGDILLAPSSGDGAGSSGLVHFSNSVASTTASGTGITVPATAAGFIEVRINGSVFKLAYYGT